MFLSIEPSTRNVLFEMFEKFIFLLIFEIFLGPVAQLVRAGDS